ncbi:SHOCT domain-containing protein [Lacticaseibacillus nasuensis]|nr:SHOCT domain-containing protein [Lacticaseibacillus nasuensis]
MDELKKLKDLLDAGAVTQEEFDAKKKTNSRPINRGHLPDHTRPSMIG